MSQTTVLGDISVPISSYEKEGQKRRRGRTIGELFRTDDNEGPRYWLKLNAEQLSPSLLIILSRNQLIKKDEDTVILNVYPPRDAQKAKSSEAPPADEGDRPF